MKGVSDILSFTFSIAIVVTAIVLVLLLGRHIVDSATSSANVKSTENILTIIDNGIKEVNAEGQDSARVVSFTTPNKMEIIPQESSVETGGVVNKDVSIQYFSRSIRGNIVLIGGSDVSCSESGDGTKLIVENTFLRGVFHRVPKSSPFGAVSTSSNVIQFTNKATNATVNFDNSSIIIDDNSSYSQGTGYSELSRSGDALPECTVHFFINSTLSYDVYYRLYAGADFFVADVRNIR